MFWCWRCRAEACRSAMKSPARSTCRLTCFWFANWACLAEKNWRRGVGLTYIVGAAIALLGIAVIVHPAFLTTVAHTTMKTGGVKPRARASELSSHLR